MMLSPFSYGPHYVATIVADFHQLALVVLGTVLEVGCHPGVRWMHASLGTRENRYKGQGALVFCDRNKVEFL